MQIYNFCTGMMQSGTLHSNSKISHCFCFYFLWCPSYQKKKKIKKIIVDDNFEIKSFHSWKDAKKPVANIFENLFGVLWKKQTLFSRYSKFCSHGPSNFTHIHLSFLYEIHNILLIFILSEQCENTTESKSYPFVDIVFLVKIYIIF